MEGVNIDENYVRRFFADAASKSGFAVKVLFHEGEPTLFGQFLPAEAVDELFLTLSPQIAGCRDDRTRPAFAQGVELAPDSAPWLHMVSVKQNAAYLYLRYRRTRTSIQNRMSRQQQDLPGCTLFDCCLSFRGLA